VDSDSDSGWDDTTPAAAPRGRVLAVDVGGRRTGLAISDATGTLARPLEVIENPDPLVSVLTAIARFAAEDDGLATVVVGLPKRLDGSPTDQTPRVTAFVAALRKRTEVPVITQDERLTSVEAESRLAVREKDWRRRKAKLDAAAAAIILQEYLDSH
jgi:putative holliday junction resolvase